MTQQPKRPKHIPPFTTLDEVMAADGTLEASKAKAIKEVIAWQLQQAMEAEGLTRKAMAKRMETSEAQLRRVLNPNDGNVTLATLQRAAELVGRKVRLDLV